ncbi:MAG: WYL domain-containing protein [Muribaculaceae bacterium]|nr:WYL domain-containing protein [Muribaculaceae bacterium]
MARDLINKYIWIVDTLNRYKRITKEELNRLWVASEISGGDPLPDRTFFHYRRAIEDIFNIRIDCDSRGRYFIDNEFSAKNLALTNWMLDSMALSSAIKENNPAEGRIEIEDVPSAREYLPLVLESIKNSTKIIFTYAGFSRSRAESKILYHPYFLKRYKQRWYMIGLKEKGNTIRTYALDRVKEMQITMDSFEMPGSLTMDQLFANIVGVTTSRAPVKKVKLQATPTQAKYFRALPLHESQKEEVHDNYSIFTYDLKLNYELAHEILSLGDAVKVIEPPELKVMVLSQLKDAIAQYEI